MHFLFFMYGLKLFFMTKTLYAHSLHVTKLYISTNCGCTPISEIREFNQKKKKKKMNISENGFFFNLTPFPLSKWTYFSTKHSFDGIFTIMSIEVQMTANRK